MPFLHLPDTRNVSTRGSRLDLVQPYNPVCVGGRGVPRASEASSLSLSPFRLSLSLSLLNPNPNATGPFRAGRDVSSLHAVARHRGHDDEARPGQLGVEAPGAAAAHLRDIHHLRAAVIGSEV